MARLCHELGCLNEALPKQSRCQECSVVHCQKTGQAVRSSPSMREAVRRIREQMERLARDDPFYARP